MGGSEGEKGGRERERGGGGEGERGKGKERGGGLKTTVEPIECVYESTFGLFFVGRFVLFQSVLYRRFHCSSRHYGLTENVLNNQVFRFQCVLKSLKYTAYDFLLIIPEVQKSTQ